MQAQCHGPVIRTERWHALHPFVRVTRGVDGHGISFVGMLNGLDRDHDFWLLPPLGPASVFRGQPSVQLCPVKLV